MRLSVTDECNFRCAYCLPNGYRRPEGRPDPLSPTEIRHLVTAFAGLGTRKVRLTGGEPTLRRDLLEIVRVVRAVPGIETVALSTNGHRLVDWAPKLREAGVSALNVSVDSLDRGRFREITGRDELPAILDGIERALGLGFASVKLNAVLLRDGNDAELESFLEWLRERPVSLRFIELMPTDPRAGERADFFSRRHVRTDALRSRLAERGWEARLRGALDGPAEEFVHPHYRGRVGLIAPYSPRFCESCNRLRVTSDGGLRLCLFAEGGQTLRPWLASADQRGALEERIRELVARKEVSHYLPAGRVGDNRGFSRMGG